MSSPFIYTPPAFQPAPLFNPSPYHPTTPLVPTSPYLGPPPALVDPRLSPYPEFPRPRKVSWHAGVPPSPFSPSSYSERRRSFGGVWDAGDRYFSPLAIHPLLSGRSPSGIHFDLSSPVFSPTHSVGSGRFTAPSEALYQPATDPPITKMCITHELLIWPIEIKPHRGEYEVIPPINVGDVLYIVHQFLRRQIRHSEWAKLDPHRRTEVTRAYTRRYMSVPATSNEEASHGVRRVDYLEDQCLFVGLAKIHDRDGFSCWELLTRQG